MVRVHVQFISAIDTWNGQIFESKWHSLFFSLYPFLNCSGWLSVIKLWFESVLINFRIVVDKLFKSGYVVVVQNVTVDSFEANKHAQCVRCVWCLTYSCDNDHQLLSIELDAGPLSCQPNRIQSKRANIFIQCHVNLYQCRPPAVLVCHAQKAWMDWVASMQIKSMKKVAHQITALAATCTGNSVKLARRKMAAPISSTPTAYQMGKLLLYLFRLLGGFLPLFNFTHFFLSFNRTHTHACIIIHLVYSLCSRCRRQLKSG